MFMQLGVVFRSALARGHARLLCFGALLLAFGVFGCSKPEPPQVTPQRATVKSVGPDGVGMRLEFQAFNPNGYALSVQSVKAKVVFNSNIELQEVTSPAAISLPGKATSPLSVDVKVPWSSLMQLTSLAGKPKVPYVVTGTVAVGGEKLNVDVPFSFSGSVTQQELVQAGLNSLPTLPGLPQLIPAP